MQLFSIWHILALLGLMWFAVISGVFVGAMFVFRTKREPHETLWQFSKPKGQAFNMEDEEDFAGIFPNQGVDINKVPGAEENEHKRKKIIGKMNDYFLRRMYQAGSATSRIDPSKENLETEETGT